MSVVRPFAAGIVRQDRAEQNVSPMFDALPASERKRSWGIDAAAYDGAAAALYVYRLRRGDTVGLHRLVPAHASVAEGLRTHVGHDAGVHLVAASQAVDVERRRGAVVRRGVDAPGPLALGGR